MNANRSARSSPAAGADVPGGQDLLRRLDAAGLPYGQELSFKLGPGRCIPDRLLVGIPLQLADARVPFGIAADLGLPEAGRALLQRELPRASTVLLATEEHGGEVLYKVYLEFWDAVRARVRAGDRTPQLLHLGVKWVRGRPGRHEEARYLCHPLLPLRDVLRRMGDSDPVTAAGTLELARRIVRRAARRDPAPSLVYLEATEAGNPRHSFDINLYPCGLLVREVQAELREAASRFGIAQEDVEGPLRQLAGLPLGHLSGGCDRRGGEFLSVYAEVAPLPARSPGAGMDGA